MDTVKQEVDKMRDGGESNWILIQSDGESATVIGQGAGDVEEAHATIKTDEPAFLFVRVFSEEEKGNLDLQKVEKLGRVKYALATFCPENITPTAKSNYVAAKPVVTTAVGNFATEIQATRVEDISSSALLEAVKKAQGANYDASANGTDQSSEGVSTREEVSFSKPKPRGGGSRRLIRGKR